MYYVGGYIGIIFPSTLSREPLSERDNASDTCLDQDERMRRFILLRLSLRHTNMSRETCGGDLHSMPATAHTTLLMPIKCAGDNGAEAEVCQ